MQPANNLAVTYLPTSALVPAHRNARTHSDRQIRQIAKSIRAFGFSNPLLIDDKNRIVAGHGRWEAAKRLGIELLPTIRLDHLTETEKRACAIALNRLAEKAGWDRNILRIELQDLNNAPDFDVEVTGFDIPEIDLIIQGSDEHREEDDASTDTSPSVVTKLGDLWRLDGHRVLCGDALDSASYVALMADKLAKLVFTDPPYNVAIQGHVGGKGKIQHDEFAMASGEMNEPEFQSFLTKACGLLAKHSEDGSIHFICMDWRHANALLSAGKAAYHELKNICVWSKTNAGMGSFYRSQHELVCVFKSGTTVHTNNIQLGRYGRSRTNVWSYPGCNSFSRNGEEGNLLSIHPTVKPVALVADAILDCSSPNQVVLDPFLGSGSTLIAADRVKRVCYGIEIEPRFVDTAIRRWQRLTGGSAVHAVTGETFTSADGAPV